VTCPHCGRANNAHSGHGTKSPQPGDMGICWDCGKIATYTVTPAGLMLRTPTPDEVQAANRHPQTSVLRDAIAAAETPREAERLFQGRRPEWGDDRG
jgi:hypothetical protein